MATSHNGQANDLRESLQGKTRKELAQLAREQRIPGWHPMRKSELIDALQRDAQQDPQPRRKRTRRKPARKRHPGVTGMAGERRDAVLARPVSSRWISVRWNISPRMLVRAESALGTEWHRARPVLRLFRIAEETEGPMAESRIRDLAIDLGTGECCIEIDHPGKAYRVLLGFATPVGEFFALSHSDPVSTRRTDGAAADEHASSSSDTSSAATSLALSGINDQDLPSLPLDIRTDLLVHGETEPETVFELDGTTVRAGRDGRFELRLPLENGRRFLPATAHAADGGSQRTVALSIERHLKLLDTRSSARI
ncbi:MAG: hypothetical protein CMJ65_17330 [Planctomycetaceae bacterium]|nr:hypothetical protein [Planctomycetaceae bacterium]